MPNIEDFKARDKETYSSAIQKKLINLGLEATKDGVREYYYDAVLDFFTDVPTSETSKKIPDHLDGKELWPGIKLSKDKTWMDIFGEIMEKYPETDKSKKDSKKINTTRTYAIKRLCIDLYDEMGILRKRVMKSRGSKKTLDSFVEEMFSK